MVAIEVPTYLWRPGLRLQLAAPYTGAAASKQGADAGAALQKEIESYSKSVTLKPNYPGLRNKYGLRWLTRESCQKMQVQPVEVARKEGVSRNSTELRVEWNHLRALLGTADVAHGLRQLVSWAGNGVGISDSV